jgi:hypothetical protein
VSPKLVARLRKVTSPCDPSIEKRLGRDGKLRPVQAGCIRERIADAIRERPGASLRAIAAELCVSPETVRSVKQKLGGGSADDQANRTAGARADREDVVATLLLLSTPRMVAAPAWRTDNALQSTPTGADFAKWFEQTFADGDTWEKAVTVPVSRVYEIADEARRRATWWKTFAEVVESRARCRAV